MYYACKLNPVVLIVAKCFTIGITTANVQLISYQ